MIDLEGIVRRFTYFGSGGRRTLRQTGLESLAVSPVEPFGFEAARAGARAAGGCQVIASGIAPVAAIPTTTATLFLYNTEPDGGKSMFVDQLGHFLGSGTAAAGATLLATLTVGKPAAVPSAAANYSSQVFGKVGRSSIGRWATAITIPSGSAWVQAASQFQLAAANVGQGDFPAQAPFGGGLLIPPGYGMGIAILSGAGTSPLYQVSASWLELQADLE